MSPLKDLKVHFSHEHVHVYILLDNDQLEIHCLLESNSRFRPFQQQTYTFIILEHIYGQVIVNFIYTDGTFCS